MTLEGAVWGALVGACVGYAVAKAFLALESWLRGVRR